MTVLRRAPTGCPVERAVHVIGGRWKTMLVFHLLPGPSRYAELRRRLPDCAERVLVRQLRELEADGVIERRALDDARRQVEYRLTPLGRELDGLFDAMRQWGERHLARGDGPAPSALGAPRAAVR